MAPSRPPRPPSRPARDPKELLKKRGADLLRKVCDRDRYAIFLEPVDTDQVEGYTDLISRPMDLSTAQKNLQMGVYRTPMELRADLDIIWSNCCKFNDDDSVYFMEAVRLRALAARYYDDLVRLLAKDGVAPALGLSSSRQNGPSSVRMSQKRPPRHRTSSQNSDFPLRMTSPSLQTSEPNSADFDADSQSGSASASAGNLTSFRDVQLRRARSNFDAALAEAATASAETRQAVETAGLTPTPPSANSQIFAGPHRILEEGQSIKAKLSQRNHKVMSTPHLRDSCCEIPISWRRIGRWHIRGVTASRFLSRNRRLDVRYGRQFQKYVDKSAPMARRLLAAILDPTLVREHDLRGTSASQYDGQVRVVGQEKSAEFHHGPSQPLESGAVTNFKPKTISDVQTNGITDPMDVDAKNTTDGKTKQEEDIRHPQRPRGKHGSPHRYIDGNSKNHIAFRDALSDALGHERLSSFSPQRISEIVESTHNALPKNSIYRLRALLKSKGIDSAFIANIINCEQENKQASRKQRDCPSQSSGVQAHRRNLANLLSSNHAIMLNIIRVRTLRENADEAALENLEDREREYVERLADGVALAVRSLPPRFVVHAQDAAESAIALAYNINSKHSAVNQ